jgi:LmbE family N-acetylglucosaminyl deacetylase
MRMLLFALCLLPVISTAQSYQQPHSSQIKLKLKKLNFLGSVLYMAAHPDDENTDIISYLSNEKLAAAAYLSLTRGDGGQNLIGPEIRDLLGLIRTQELLAARKIDGGQQFFTRANDFGYSKSADETFQIWGKDNIFHDAVKVIRQYQPDVIITRFPPDERAGHGHHTASAIFAGEAYDASGKNDVFPEQVKELGVWQVKRVYTNTGRWWNKDINENTPGIITLDVGGYSALLGKSISEISALSSSQHKSQGWGRPGERGYSAEFLEPVKGDKAQKDIFEGIETSWSRLKGGEKIKPIVEKLIRDYNEEDPSSIVPQLFQLRKEITALEDGVWKRRKLAETEQLIQDCLGLFLETKASYFQVSPGESLKANIEIVNRSKLQIHLQNISSEQLKWDTLYNNTLALNTMITLKSNLTLDAAAEYSEPYWLKDDHGLGLFTVNKKEYIGLPENPPAIDFSFTVRIGSDALTLKRPLIYKWVDPVKGELWRRVEVVPPVFINATEKVVIFNDDTQKQITFMVKSSVNKPVGGKLSVTLPQGWISEPAFHTFDLTKREGEIRKTFSIIPPSSESVGKVAAIAEVDGKKYNQAIQYISYDHFPIQTLLPDAEIKIVKIGLKTEGKTIAYIRGAGDEVPAALRNMGYNVWEMQDSEVTSANLKSVDAVVLGVRAVNTNSRLRFFIDDLLEFVNNGGTMVVQYNSNFDYETDKFSPYNLKLSRDRVTQEDSEVRILKPEHEVLNKPNKITAKDFEGWVQERGLYFPGQWDPQFETILSMNDKGEQPKESSLLVAKYGQGYYVYTGLSFFRELPEGVPGAYKLFANLVSLGRAPKPQASKVKGKAR